MGRYFILAALMGLSACGGGGGGDGGGSGIDPRLARIDIYEAQKQRVLGDPGAGVMGMAPTPDASIPDTGTAVFTGSATIRVENPGAALVLFGDSTVTIGFDTATVSGTMDNFFGTNGNGNVVDFSGTITVDDGSVEPGVALDYAGALTASGEDLVFEGVMQGEFLGDPVGAISAADLEAGVIRNGTPLDGTVIVIGETDGVTIP